MKILLFTFIFILNNYCVYGQNETYLKVEFGVSSVYKQGGIEIYFEPDNVYFGSIYWNKNTNPAYSIGVFRETKAFNFLGKKKYLITDLSISYRPYINKKVFNFIELSNNLYFPLKAKDKRFQFTGGIRNTVILWNMVPKENDIFIKRPLHLLGVSSLINYRLTEKLNVGINTYFDIFPIGFSGSHPYRTIEALFCLQYRISKSKEK